MSRRHQMEPETKVQVVPSRYALALQQQNRRVRSGSANTPTVDTNSIRAPSTKRPVSCGVRPNQRRANTTPALRSKPRPVFPLRPSTSVRKANNQATKMTVVQSRSSTRGSKRETQSGVEKDSVVLTKSAQAGETAGLTETDELELLQSVYYQLCFVEAKAEDTFRRQEQRAETQMLAAWGVLQSKLEQLQNASLSLDRQTHEKFVEDHIENLLVPSMQVAEQLPRLVGNVSQLCASLKDGLSRLKTPGFTCSNPLELKHQLDALAAELDKLLEFLESTRLADNVSSIVSFERDMKELSCNTSVALLQVAHLVKMLSSCITKSSSPNQQDLKN